MLQQTWQAHDKVGVSSAFSVGLHLTYQRQVRDLAAAAFCVYVFFPCRSSGLYLGIQCRQPHICSCPAGLAAVFVVPVCCAVVQEMAGGAGPSGRTKRDSMIHCLYTFNGPVFEWFATRW